MANAHGEWLPGSFWFVFLNFSCLPMLPLGAREPLRRLESWSLKVTSFVFLTVRRSLAVSGLRVASSPRDAHCLLAGTAATAAGLGRASGRGARPPLLALPSPLPSSVPGVSTHTPLLAVHPSSADGASVRCRHRARHQRHSRE